MFWCKTFPLANFATTNKPLRLSAFPVKLAGVYDVLQLHVSGKRGRVFPYFACSITVYRDQAGRKTSGTVRAALLRHSPVQHQVPVGAAPCWAPGCHASPPGLGLLRRLGLSSIPMGERKRAVFGMKAEILEHKTQTSGKRARCQAAIIRALSPSVFSIPDHGIWTTLMLINTSC